MKSEIIDAEKVVMNGYEQEQYALVYYLEHGNPGPIFKQIAEDRIKELELIKSRAGPVKYYPVTSPMPRLEFEKDCETVGSYKK